MFYAEPETLLGIIDKSPRGWQLSIRTDKLMQEQTRRTHFSLFPSGHGTLLTVDVVDLPWTSGDMSVW